MITDGTTQRRSRSFLSVVCLSGSLTGSLATALAAGMLAGGCSDIVTFSQQYHEDGMKLYDQKDYANAAGAFRNAVHQVPNDYTDHYYLADCYAKLGQNQQAIQQFRACYQIMMADGLGRQDKKLHDQVLDGWAAAIANGDQHDAEINAAEADAHEHQTADNYLLLAKVYSIKGDADSAIGAYSRAMRIAPDSFAISKEYGLYLMKLGQNQKAAEPLRQAYALNSNDRQVTDALRQIGVVPGPSILDRDALAKPLLPTGPLPEIGGGSSPAPAANSSNGENAMPAASQQPPRD